MASPVTLRPSTARAKSTSEIHSGSSSDVSAQGRELGAWEQSQHKSTYYASRGAKYDKQRKEISKARLGFLIAFIVAIGFLVTWQFVWVYLKYGDFIQFMNKNRPKAIWAPSGMATAFTLEMPALGQLVGFTNPAIAQAALLSYSGKNLSDVFKKKPTKYLAQIWNVGTFGLPTLKNPDPNAMTIICEGWACDAGIKMCLPTCPTFDTPWADMFTGGALSGMNGVFMAGIAKPGAGKTGGAMRGGMFVGFFLLGAGLSFWRASSAHKAAVKHTGTCAKV